VNYRASAQALRDRRDREIRRLKQENPSLACQQIAALVGCAHGTVGDVLSPEKRRARIARWKRQHLKAVS
jgi:hypothetical protein